MKKFILQRRWIGRFGNRVHQYAYAATYKKKYDVDYFVISRWEGDHLFKHKQHEVIQDHELREVLISFKNDSRFYSARLNPVEEYATQIQQPIKDFSPQNPDETWIVPDSHVTFENLCAYEPRIFEGMSKTHLLDEVFVFSDEVTNTEIYRRFEDRQGKYDIAHLRRDDVARLDKKSIYPCISKLSYLRAFKKYGIDPVGVEWTTDDCSGKWGVGSPLDHSKKKLGFRYPTGSILDADGNIIFDWFPDFLRIYFARNIFRANSSFSFWAAFIALQRPDPPNVFSPRINERIFFGDPDTPGQELYCDFEPGNHPHWMLNSRCPDIFIQ